MEPEMSGAKSHDESSAAITHGVQACYDNGESWNLVCDCQWECWEQPDEETARKLHTRHVADETHPNQREVLRWRMVQEENRVRAEQRETCKRSAASSCPVPEGQECPTCRRRVPRAKKPSSPKTKVVSLRVPVSDAEIFEEILEQAAKNAGIYESGHWRYFTVLRGLVHVLQESPERGV